MAIDKKNLKRKKTKTDEDGENEEQKTTAGAIERLVDYAFNPSDEKLREMTVINRMEGMLLPIVDILGTERQNILDIVSYRYDPTAFEKIARKKYPESPDLVALFVKRKAQWNKSIEGRNLKEAINVTLADIEVRSGEEDMFGNEPDIRG